MSAPEAGGPGGEDASSEAGAKSNGGEESRLARLRRRLSPGRSEPSRPETPPEGQASTESKEPPLPEGPAPTPTKPLFSLDPPEEEKKPNRSSELAFKARTRLRAIGYWLREKGQIAWRWLKRASAESAAWWARRSRGTKIRVGAVAGILVLYLVIKLVSVPGVPCEISAAKECAPSNDTIAYVPRNAALYVHLTVNSESHQWDLEQDLAKTLPSFTALLQSDTRALTGPAGRPVDLSPGGAPLGQGRPRAARRAGAEGNDARDLHRGRRRQRQGQPVHDASHWRCGACNR